MTQPLNDPAILQVIGKTPEEVRTRLNLELDRFEAQLRGRQADWMVTQPGRNWSPAQEVEHVLKLDNSVIPVLRRLLSNEELQATSQIFGEIVDGKRQSPEALLPSQDGLPFEALGTTWAEHRQQLEDIATQVKPTPGRTSWHEFFGEIDALDWLRMVAMHLRSHRKLLEVSAAG